MRFRKLSASGKGGSLPAGDGHRYMVAALECRSSPATRSLKGCPSGNAAAIDPRLWPVPNRNDISQAADLLPGLRREQHLCVASEFHSGFGDPL
jgi:hypothetical protein